MNARQPLESPRPNIPAPLLIVLALLLASLLACVSSPPTDEATDEATEKPTAKTALPTFADPKLRAYKAEFLRDKQAFENDPERFFPTAGDAVECTLPKKMVERLAYDMPVEKWKDSALGLTSEFHDLRWAVLQGDCSNGRLHGDARFVAAFVWVRDSNVTTITSPVERTIVASFGADGIVGEFRRYTRIKAARVLNKATGSTTESTPGLGTVKYQYGALKGGLPVDKNVSFSTVETGQFGPVRLTERISDEIRRETLYEGEQIFLTYHTNRDGQLHGEWFTPGRETENGEAMNGKRLCFQNGEVVDMSHCE